MCLRDVTIENEFIRDVHGHETLVSWNTDQQNVIFQEWLFEEGFNMFEKYYEGVVE